MVDVVVVVDGVVVCRIEVEEVTVVEATVNVDSVYIVSKGMSVVVVVVVDDELEVLVVFVDDGVVVIDDEVVVVVVDDGRSYCVNTTVEVT